MPDLTLTEADNGRPVAVHVGDAITIRLPENASTGYRWSAAGVDRAHLSVDPPRIERTSEAVGSAGTSVWTVRATQPGTTRLELRKARSWEQSAIERFTIDITVAER
jgi:inhibitor of cysteine peptidase